ncbi:MAG: MMPL family transporter [Myxococcales bacterium]
MRYAAFLVAALACLAIAVFGLEVRTSITEFLPRDNRSKLLELARELSNAPQSRLVVITVGGASSEGSTRTQRAAQLREKLERSGLFEWVRGSVASSDQEEAYALFYPARLGLAQLPGTTGPVPSSWLSERIRALKDRLASPLGMLERRLAPGDPLGLFVEYLQRQQGARGSLRVEDGQLVTADGHWSVLFAATRAPAFDSAAQRGVATLLTHELATLERAGIQGEWIGVNRFALEGERSVKGDIERISSLSLIGIFLLYWLIFRSLREPLLVLLPISFGCLLAVAVCQLCFGFVHGLTLAFGSSIIGVAEDYSTHFFSHRIAVGSTEDNESLMRRLWPGMWMGGLTTMAGIAALGVSGFPGLIQMALFGVVGVLGALLCTRYVLPGLSRRRGREQQGKLGALGERLVKALSIRPLSALWFVVPAVLVTVVGVPRASFRDGLSSLRTPTEALDAENKRIQARLGRGAGGRMVVALGGTDQEALERAEEAQRLLERAGEKGLIASFRGPSGLMPSETTQRLARSRFANDPEFTARLDAVLTGEGFVAAAFQPFLDEVSRRDPVFLTPEQVLSSKLSDLLLPFRAKLPSGIAYLTQVDTVRSAELSGLFADEPGLFYVDQEALFSQAYGEFRARTLWLVVSGLGLVLLTLWLRYRDLKLCLLGMVPAVLGAGAALGAQGLWGTPLNLMHVIGMLLVLSMGVDYGIYMLESRESVEEGVVTLGSVLLAALTTVLSFGLLGLSENPALAGIGMTVSLGLVFTVVMSPVVLVWTQAKRTA